MYYYKYNDKILLSLEKYENLVRISEEKARGEKGIFYFLKKLDPLRSRRSYCISAPWLAFIEKEGLNLLQSQENDNINIPSWLCRKIEDREVMAVNTEHPHWKEALEFSFPKKWRVHIAGLGDVGGILAAGLRLLGGHMISHIGLYDLDPHKINRWVLECSQIYSPSQDELFSEVYPLSEKEIFDCDMFVFCVSVGVPPINDNVQDVRMAQFDGNSRIIKNYAKMARNAKFKGIFSVVSDPVDQLCSVALRESNLNEEGMIDFEGLSPEQVRGYGLGVMNGRAIYYSRQIPEALHYREEGRVFGPHGQGLVVADSISNYNHSLSLYLTEKTLKANLEVRATGFKPYIAPAISSGSLSLIATMEGSWHYSSTFLGGVFMGARNRLNKSGIEIETLNIPSLLWERLQSTYEGLKMGL